MGHTLKKKKPKHETMATAQAVQEVRTGDVCEDCNTTEDVTQYCSDCGLAVCTSCYSDEGHEEHDE